VHEFLEAVHLVVRLRSWTKEDKKYAAKLKLGGTARRFYLNSTELHDQHITWVKFSETFGNQISVHRN